MFGPFSLWSPIFRFPLSGDIHQDIDPEFTTHIAGVPEIELAVIRDVASYGAQLDKVLEALRLLSDKTEVALPEIDSLYERVREVKMASSAALEAHAVAALDRLRSVDEDAWSRVKGR
ncbi:hypothetical protein P775_25060 [Puniceibacterium antarcticum]|uniref:Uncharacterized protein n=1 Tax=Puniceibacterium antarcticum TaxID=1206336 RepID=A0A2G8R3X8_9RHOB|nr:hypothetical protein [Puniceibacterium antarcticum]PIL16233.1 hypothetical protein P775_25060 [Puniceibacterium antarcticum]